MQLRRLASANADLDAIWLYIARDSPLAATRTVARIIATIDRLSDYPRSGSPRRDIAAEARSLTVGAYVVLYRIDDGCVVIVRVVHGARNLSVTVKDFAP